ncbi:MAG: M12 family metallo-peptidase [Pseudomonadota bacterium]|nr:M12 family metallo-peptidase [Pseudomonadota bacterium]
MATLVLSGVTAAAFALDNADSQIRYFEPLQLATSPGPAQQKSSQTRELRFDAYGRRFVVTLEPNENLSSLLQAKSASGSPAAGIELYRGQINGDARSWARLSMLDGKLQGMLWDGTEIYVIEPLAKLRDALPAGAELDDDATAIFRLADVTMTPGATSCGTDTSIGVTKGIDAYNSMVSELKGTPAIMQAAGATRRLEISVLGDTLLLSRFGGDSQARDEILARLNIVDGIYSSQLGVQISVPNITFGDSLSATTSASSLLNELGDLRRRSSNLNARGLTHLFTARDLDGTTVGIAFISSVCDRQYGAGLTEARNRSAWTESLITAHEIGHNFGAPHDGDADEACASTPVGQFLMSSSINGNDTFSSCSLSIMQPKAASASCITTLSKADIAVDANLGSVREPLDSAFDWQLTVRNTGGLTTTDARAEIALPSAFTIDEAFVNGGTCTGGGGLITCELGDIAGGSSAVIQLVLRSSTAGSYPISVDVSAANETNVGNNHGQGTISTQPEVDLAVSLQAPASSAAGMAFNTTLAATNRSDIDADTVTVTLSLPEGVTAANATLGGTNCTIGTASISCSLSALAAGTTATGSATLTASAPGNTLLQAQISSSQLDRVPSNDSAAATVSVTNEVLPAAQSTSSGGGGGGGGGTGAGFLALLIATLGMKKLQRRPIAR